MSNAPDRFDKFVLPEGVKKVAYAPDTKVANAGTFTVQREDHTVGNLVRMQLHRDKSIIFAGYKIPHPLEYRMLLKVQTNGKPGKAPIQVMMGALQDLQEEVADIRGKFSAQLVEQGRDGP